MDRLDTLRSQLQRVGRDISDTFSRLEIPKLEVPPLRLGNLAPRTLDIAHVRQVYWNAARLREYILSSYQPAARVAESFQLGVSIDF
jgi:hypothetical protein